MAIRIEGFSYSRDNEPIKDCVFVPIEYPRHTVIDKKYFDAIDMLFGFKPKPKRKSKSKSKLRTILNRNK